MHVAWHADRCAFPVHVRQSVRSLTDHLMARRMHTRSYQVGYPRSLDLTILDNPFIFPSPPLNLMSIALISRGVREIAQIVMAYLLSKYAVHHDIRIRLKLAHTYAFDRAV